MVVSTIMQVASCNPVLRQARGGTGRKFLRGPRGTGFLYVNQAVLEKLIPVFMNLRSADWISESVPMAGGCQAV